MEDLRLFVFALETNQLIEQGNLWGAALYVGLSVIGAVAAVYVAQFLFAR